MIPNFSFLLLSINLTFIITLACRCLESAATGAAKKRLCLNFKISIETDAYATLHHDFDPPPGQQISRTKITMYTELDDKLLDECPGPLHPSSLVSIRSLHPDILSSPFYWLCLPVCRPYWSQCPYKCELSLDVFGVKHYLPVISPCTLHTQTGLKASVVIETARQGTNIRGETHAWKFRVGPFQGHEMTCR